MKILAAAQFFVAFSYIKFCVTIDSGFRIFLHALWTNGAILLDVTQECELAEKVWSRKLLIFEILGLLSLILNTLSAP